MDLSLFFRGLNAQLSVIGLAGMGALLASTDAAHSFWLSVAGVIALVVYRVFRQFRREPIKGTLDFIDRNIVELILAAIIAPNTAAAILHALR